MHPRRSLPTPKEPRSRGKASKEAAPLRFQDHPLFGRIPLIPRTATIASTGKSYIAYDYDPGYQPALPRGAVRGDIRRQNLCFWCNVPRYFYVDEHKTCVQCGRDFVFGAREQKYWYETLNFYGTSTAVRCQECRRKRRSEKGLRIQLASVKAELKQSPEDPALLLSLAETVVRYHQMKHEGNLAEGIAAARRARTLAPKAHEAMFWEAFCHIEGSREVKGRELLVRFLNCPLSTKKQHDLQREAKQYLGQ
jgi:hypothetical protein